MKHLITILALLAMTFAGYSDVQAQTWESLYNTYSINDPFFEQDIFQVPLYDSRGELQSRTRTWKQLKGKARRLAKNHLRVFYDVRPSGGGYIVGALQTTFRSVGRTVVYIGTMAVAAIVVGTLTNQRPG